MLLLWVFLVMIFYTAACGPVILEGIRQVRWHMAATISRETFIFYRVDVWSWDHGMAGLENSGLVNKFGNVMDEQIAAQHATVKGFK
jgi:hypothetical protein